MDSNHEILGFVIPTNEPDVAFSYLLSSLDGLKDAAPISTFLFNFQKPWTYDQIRRAVKICESYGFAVRYTFNSYEIKGKGLVPFNQIRGDASKLMPEAKFFMLMDDDFSFRGRSSASSRSAGDQIVDIVHYMVSHPNCGITLLKGNYYLKEVNKYEVAPAVSIDNRYVTDKGIILKNFDPDNGLVVPNEALALLGSDEEKLACAWRLFHGYYPAVINHARILHYENCNSTMIENAPVTGETMYGWNTNEILEANTNKFIREHFYKDFKNRAWRITQLVDYEQYLQAGGFDITDANFRSLATVNYESRSTIKNIQDIESLTQEVMQYEKNCILSIKCEY